MQNKLIFLYKNLDVFLALLKYNWQDCNTFKAYNVLTSCTYTFWKDSHNCANQPMDILLVKNQKTALAGVVQWIECQPVNQKVAGAIPSPGICLGCGPGPWLGACKRQMTDVSSPHWYSSPSLSPSLILSLKINK